MKKNILKFSNWKRINEGKLRNELVRNAGRGYDIKNLEDGSVDIVQPWKKTKHGFDQKSAYDEMEDTTELDNLYKELSHDPIMLKRFLLKMSKHVSIEDIESAMKSAIDISRSSDNDNGWDLGVS